MLPTAKKLHTTVPLLEKISILIVSPQIDDYSSVRQILRNGCWDINHASNLDEAASYFKDSKLSVIICERDLPDGNWKDLLNRVQELPKAPSFLVVSRHADEKLWADVLNFGGYDVLLKPFDRREMVRIVSMAWRHCHAKLPRKPSSSERGGASHFAHATVV
jgi:two-component system, chemotaxis family, chemotaxis protein CheY